MISRCIVRCRECKEYKDIPVTRAQLEAWTGGMLIQRAMPNVSPDDRELLISGTCGPCFDKMFDGEEG